MSSNRRSTSPHHHSNHNSHHHLLDPELGGSNHGSDGSRGHGQPLQSARGSSSNPLSHNSSRGERGGNGSGVMDDHHSLHSNHSSSHHQQQQQQPVNFGADGGNGYQSRRVTIGGNTGSTSMDRRGSLASLNLNMDDFFGSRRPSMGMDNMDTLFGRRDSLDSTTAALDAAIFDLTRRRYSMAVGPGGIPPTDMPAGGLPSSGSSGSLGMMGPPAVGNGPYSPAGGSLGNPAVSSLAARQQQLQQQQRELERRQKELEMQRQQLIASMQERSLMMQQQHHHQQMLSSHSQHSHGSAGYGSGGGGASYHQHHQGSLGLGSVHSHTSHASVIPSTMPAPHRPSAPPAVAGSQQWWICQFCNTKAFASHEEAMQHEMMCPDRKYAPHMHPGHMDMSMGHSQRSQNEMSVSRTFSLGMDSSMASYDNPVISHGPFALMDKPMPLAMPSDRDWLTPLHCFVRRHCVEVFTASEGDVATPSKGKRKPIQVGQVGIRCPHCHHDASKARERGSVYYPTTIASIYNATMNLLQRHLHSCTSVPDDIMRRYETLKADDARSGTSKRYWVESALSLGLVDTPTGIRFSALEPPPLPSLTRQQETTGVSAGRRNSNEFFSTSSNAVTKDVLHASSAVPSKDRNKNKNSKEQLSDKRSITGDFDDANSSRNDIKEEDIDATASLANKKDTKAPPSKEPKASKEDGKASKEKKESKKSDDKKDAERSKSASPTADDINDTVPDSDLIPKSEQKLADSAPLVTPEDKPYSTDFSYHLLSQMQPCVFTEADRLGKRKGLPPGFPGLACRHCFGGYGSGRFFPSSIKTLSDTSKTLNVLHNHMMRCRKCPAEVRESLEKLRGSHDEERAKMKFGSQKAFFARIWDRLHGKDAPHSGGTKRKGAPGSAQGPRHSNAMMNSGHPSTPFMHAPQPQSMGYGGPMHPGYGGGGGGGGYQTSPHGGYGGHMAGQGPYNMPMSSSGGYGHHGMPPQTMGMGGGGLDTLAMASDPKRHKTH